ncbi:hypothetical protein ACQ4WX_01195 [Streptomyces lasalocidi]
MTLSAADGAPPPALPRGTPARRGRPVPPAAARGHPRRDPLGPVYGCRLPEHRWRHYEKLRRWPDRFLVVGDAFVTLDPAHGHGMTSAVESALVLGRLLAAHGTTAGLSHRLRRALAQQLAPAWAGGTRPGRRPPRPSVRTRRPSCPIASDGSNEPSEPAT